MFQISSLNTKVLTEVNQLINDPSLFGYEIEQLQLKTDVYLLNRLTKWQNFFNQQFMNAPCMYTQMNFALIEAAESNEIFKSQTTHEFNLSLDFFKRLHNTRIFLILNDLEAAKYLLRISLVFSKFPGMVVRSFRASFKCLADGITITKLYTVFESLFVKYESPKI
ncbi:MAG: hypothetical protein HKN86_00510, partial [Acidimicrobiia bacterium]|nr:hypothetical protein [Acidimicrobiia bacterium]